MARLLVRPFFLLRYYPFLTHQPTSPKRIPFYYFFKMLFLLYIALPQTQGASYLYQTQLAPALRAHESQIDAALAQLRMRVFAFLQARARMLWDYIIASATGPAAGSSSTTGAASSSSTTGGGGASAQQGPPLSDSVSGPTQMLGTLWRTYGPAIVAGGTALLQQQRSGAPPPPPPMRGYDVDGGASDGSSSIQMMPPSQSRTSSAESASGLRGRVGSGTNFEEVEVPSDAESERAGGGMRAPAPRRATSGGWFGWGSGAHEKAD